MITCRGDEPYFIYPEIIEYCKLHTDYERSSFSEEGKKQRNYDRNLTLYCITFKYDVWYTVAENSLTLLHLSMMYGIL